MKPGIYCSVRSPAQGTLLAWSLATIYGKPGTALPARMKCPYPSSWLRPDPPHHLTQTIVGSASFYNLPPSMYGAEYPCISLLCTPIICILYIYLQQLHPTSVFPIHLLHHLASSFTFFIYLHYFSTPTWTSIYLPAGLAGRCYDLLRTYLLFWSGDLYLFFTSGIKCLTSVQAWVRGGQC